MPARKTSAAMLIATVGRDAHESAEAREDRLPSRTAMSGDDDEDAAGEDDDARRPPARRGNPVLSESEGQRLEHEHDGPSWAGPHRPA
jgi:hypothetical protein